MADRQKAFNVQRPSAANASSSRAVPGSSRARSDQRATTTTATAANASRRNIEPSSHARVEEDDEIDADAATIPSKLLTRILHEHFVHPDTKMTAEASKAIAKYMDILVREAIARAKYERDEAAGGALGAERFLEVEDLEKLAPQLLLDF